MLHLANLRFTIYQTGGLSQLLLLLVVLADTKAS
jgi:hypothetical protein